MKFKVRPFRGVGLAMLFVFSILMLGYGAISALEDKDYTLCLLFSLFTLLGIVASIIESKKWWREHFSTIRFDENGIRNHVIRKEDIFISWHECVEVGVGLFTHNKYGYVYCFYFSKVPLSNETILNLAVLHLNDTHLWVHYRPKVLAEITKYIDESEIKGLELIKKKRKVRKREKSR